MKEHLALFRLIVFLLITDLTIEFIVLGIVGTVHYLRRSSHFFEVAGLIINVASLSIDFIALIVTILALLSFQP